jgi:hypothetical protein
MFLYFIPTDKGIADAALLKSVGLGYALNDPPAVNSLRIQSGPGAAPGLLCLIEPAPGAAAEGSPLRYAPQDQTWRKRADGKFWVGLTNPGRPAPEQLIRARFISGIPIRLADGNDWTIPICLSIARGSSLPKALVLGEDGESWTLEELPEFISLCGDAETIWAAFQKSQAGQIEFNLKEATRIAAAALGVNYRLGILEASLLRLLTTQNIWEILQAMIDLSAVMQIALEHQKKASDAAGSSTDSGARESSPIMSPPSGT